MITEWISVEDRLPDKTGDYLVTTKNGYVQIAKWGYGLYKTEGWTSKNLKNCVVAWMECPKAYGKEK